MIRTSLWWARVCRVQFIYAIRTTSYNNIDYDDDDINLFAVLRGSAIVFVPAVQHYSVSAYTYLPICTLQVCQSFIIDNDDD